MWFNDLPNGALQISFNGQVEILDVDQQRQLGRVLAQRGMVSKSDVRDAWPVNNQ